MDSPASNATSADACEVEEMDRWIDPRIALAERYPGYDISELDHLVEDEGLRVKYIPERMKVLFETPSGFAIFAIDSGYLYDIGSDYTGIETIWVHCVDEDSADFFVWLKSFVKLKNRSTAISTTGIDESLAQLIEEECNRGEKLIVGESAYKEAIEDQLAVPCICDEAAEELMWGLQNLLHVLVPEEKSEFSKQDRKYHSQKLLDYLHTNVSDDIKPEMINGQIALLASVMQRCDVTSKEYSASLHSVDNVLEDRSGLNTSCWDTVTHATALMTLIGESVVMPDGMFTSVETKAILDGVGKYNDKIIKGSIQKIYKKAVQANNLQFAKLSELKTLLDEAKEEREEVLGELPQVFSPKRSCQEEAEGDGQRKKLKRVNDDDGDMVQSGATTD